MWPGSQSRSDLRSNQLRAAVHEITEVVGHHHKTGVGAAIQVGSSLISQLLSKGCFIGSRLEILYNPIHLELRHQFGYGARSAYTTENCLLVETPGGPAELHNEIGGSN